MHEILYSVLTPDDPVKIEVGQATNLTNHASSRALHLMHANEFFRRDVTSLVWLRDTSQGRMRVQRS